MVLSFFSSSNSKRNGNPKSKFTLRQTQQAKPTEQPTAPLCPAKAYIPHHRNLGVTEFASDEEIKAAWRNLGRRIHPDKIRNPAMKDNATAAIVLVNEARDKLFKRAGSWIYWKKTKEPDPSHGPYERIMADKAEQRRRLEEAKKCDNVVRRKPWFWAYKTQKQCETDGDSFCGEFWATIGHNFLDYPRSVSDWVWDVVDDDWRYPIQSRPPLEVLTFYGPCSQTYTVTIPVLEVHLSQNAPPRWSSFWDTPCNTSLFVGDLFPAYDMTLLAVLIAIWLFIFGRLLKRVIHFAFNMLLFGILLILWCVLWAVKKLFMLCIWPIQKLYSSTRQLFRVVLGKLNGIMQHTKRYLHGTGILRLVFYLLELGQAWQEKIFSMREALENKGSL